MRKTIILLVIILGTGSVVQAEPTYERQLEHRIEQLRLENERLYRENEQLKRQLGRRQIYRPYGYGNNTLRQSNQTLREVEQFKRQIEEFGR